MIQPHNGHPVQKRRSRERNLLISFWLNLGITLVELTGGLVSNSLALVSDAFHNLGDTLAILISYVAILYGRKPSNQRKTFGYQRLEILAALFNAAVLIGISLFLFFEAYERFVNPRPVRSLLMLSVAVTGLAANLVSVLLLKKDSKKSLNVRAAYVHLLGDTLSSVGVIAGAVAMMIWKVYWIDPLLTILIGIFIIRETFVIIRDTIGILMEAAPRDIDLDSIKAALEADHRVDNVHHIHVWQLSDRQVHFECHADFSEDLPLSQVDRVRQDMETLLREQFLIHHVTIQTEYNSCTDKNIIHGA